MLPPGATATEAQCRRRYRRHVEAGLLRGVEDPFAQLRGQAILGSESFAQSALDRVADWRERRRETTAVRQLLRAKRPASPLVATGGLPLTPALVLDAVASRYQVTAESLAASDQRGRWSEARGVAMVLVHRFFPDLGYRRIGELFGGSDHAAVAQRIRRMRARDEVGRLRHPLRELAAACAEECQNV